MRIVEKSYGLFVFAYGGSGFYPKLRKRIRHFHQSEFAIGCQIVIFEYAYDT
jgi:hypothetical protein